MGYPMNYGRVLGRNKLDGDYDPAEHTGLGLIRGDLRRMEKDQQDDAHVAAYARRAGTTFAQAKQILADVFSDQDVLWQPAPNNPEVAAAPEARAQEDALREAVKRHVRATAAHVRENAEALKKYDWEKNEARCRELCAMYLEEIALSMDMGDRIAELSRLRMNSGPT